MRKFLTLIVALLALIAVPISASFSQAIQHDGAFLMAGTRQEGSLNPVVGIGIPLNDNLYGTVTFDLERSGSMNVEALYLVQIPKSAFYMGPLLGPSVQLEDEIGDDASPLTRFLGTAGFAGVYSINKNIGALFYYKETMDLEETTFEDRWNGGLMLTIRF